MSNSMMIKVTNNGTATTDSEVFGRNLAANEVIIVSLHGYGLKFDSNNNIDSITNLTNGAEFSGSASGANFVARIQLGNLSRAGVFYTVADID